MDPARRHAGLLEHGEQAVVGPSLFQPHHHQMVGLLPLVDQPEPRAAGRQLPGAAELELAGVVRRHVGRRGGGAGVRVVGGLIAAAREHGGRRDGGPGDRPRVHGGSEGVVKR